MPEGSNKIKTTHVGSLIRPDDIVDAMRRIFRGEEVDLQRHNARLTEAGREVVRRQKEAGVDIVSDGEFGKIGWNFYVYERLGGIEVRPPQNDTFSDMPIRATDWERFPEFYEEYFRAEQDFETPAGVFAAVDSITYTGQEAIGRDIANLKAAMEAEGVAEGFLPVVAPASCFPNLIDEHYGSQEAALMGVAEALREEYRAIVEAGLSVQVDDAFIPFMYDVLVPPGTMEDYLAWAQPRIDAVNHALEGIPEDKVRYHICWGSWNGPHTNDIPLRDVLGLLLQVNAGMYLFEAANPRATSTSGGCGRTLTCPTARSSRRASSAMRPTSSSTLSSWLSASSASLGSGRTGSWAAPTAASPRVPTCAACTPRSSGPSSRRSPRARRSPLATSAWRRRRSDLTAGIAAGGPLSRPHPHASRPRTSAATRGPPRACSPRTRRRRIGTRHEKAPLGGAFPVRPSGLEPPQASGVSRF